MAYICKHGKTTKNDEIFKRTENWRQHQRYLGVLLRKNNTANIVDSVLSPGAKPAIIEGTRYACNHHLGAQPVGRAEGGLDLWLAEISFRKNSAYQRSHYPSIRPTDRVPRRSLNAHPQFMLSQDLIRLGLVWVMSRFNFVAFLCQFFLSKIFKISEIVMKIRIDIDRLILLKRIFAHSYLLYNFPNLKQKILSILDTNMYWNLKSITFANFLSILCPLILN